MRIKVRDIRRLGRRLGVMTQQFQIRLEITGTTLAA
jgi:hypothetical protein